ncbi:MAG: glucokinase, partial [Bdellovibrionales bacterium]
QGVWRFVNKNRWVIDPAALAASGWPVDIIMNDFEAATWALPDLPPEDQRVLKQKENQYDTYCLLGPGTGLGLGYLHHARAQKPFVQKTHGGHMPIAGLNDEHDKIIAQIRARQDKAVVFETILSGAGYHMLQELTDAPTAMRLFHEFLGLFAATAVVAGHAYGGVYLTGGVVQHLVDNGVFDLTAFDRGFCFNAVASVRRDLQNTPIIYITDPTPALRGLLACQKRI